MTPSPGFPNEHTPIGSTRYYVARFAPAEERDAQALLLALHASLMALPRECTDPGVARTKLAWWREQLLEAGDRASHPLARSLAGLSRDQQPERAYLERLLDNLRDEIDNRPVTSGADLDNHCRGSGGTLCAMLTALGGGDAGQLACAEAIGQFTRRVEIVRDLGHDIRRRRCYLPREHLKEHRIDLERIFDHQTQQRLTVLLTEFAAEARQRLDHALGQLPRTAHHPLGSAFALAMVKDALLSEIAADGFRVLNQRTGLPPLRKLWISWRSHRRSRRARGLSPRR
ncbi:MAG: squalene/phytoene synthase family protein [Candidatus Sedimenticola endophacoides]|nr:MAG: hypothetical protein B0D94_05745 [Candidatus Sedimenticola endophacoides]OQX40187.1 MAG: hypothetical protein B0D89_08650 [Candidatus Sedimenticola endophacoides]